MTDNDKPNCYQCSYRRRLAGSAHSACAHPDACGSEDPFAVFMETAGGLMGNDDAIQKLGIVGDPHGIRNGWFFWPSNFDPVWLCACDGFTRKDQAVKETDGEG